MDLMNIIFVIGKPNSTHITSVTGTVNAVDQTQLPTRFKRATLDEAEINAINVCTLKEKIHFSVIILKCKFYFQSGGAE